MGSDRGCGRVARRSTNGEEGKRAWNRAFRGRSRAPCEGKRSGYKSATSDDSLPTRVQHLVFVRFIGIDAIRARLGDVTRHSEKKTKANGADGALSFDESGRRWRQTACAHKEEDASDTNRS